MNLNRKINIKGLLYGRGLPPEYLATITERDAMRWMYHCYGYRWHRLVTQTSKHRRQ